MVAPKKPTDFDAEKLTQDVEQHSEEVSDLDDRVTVIENRLKNAEQITEIFEIATKDSKKFDAMLSKMFCDMLDKDEAVKSAVGAHVEKTDRSAVKKHFKRWGGLLLAATIFILGGVATKLIDWLFSKLPQ